MPSNEARGMVAPMKKALSLAILLTNLPASLAVAQTTWNGLRFGMSPKDAIGVMAASKTNMHSPDPQKLISSNDFDLKLPNTTMLLPLNVELDFDTKGLNLIVLQLDVREFRRRSPDITSDAMAMYIVNKFIYEALHERYGNPLNMQDDCDPLGAVLTWQGCSANWSVDDVDIGYMVTSIGSTNSVLIQYRPIQNAL